MALGVLMLVRKSGGRKWLKLMVLKCIALTRREVMTSW